ncbi:MMS19 nucleotide excision repair protein homolog isoform X2 [Polyodon spathula]|uniref:MMS19 nucleotide excision repair protein homolog isoform X2 n=1 Tax=Polyodon spathula TaxID=7913 RepID=UPI001B7E64DE|nr:MMS19 nucleotide excision repair protein homolog isoform X2 [Polyodon spathula]
MAGNGGALLLGLVEQFVTGLQDSKAADTSAGVKKGQFTVLELVEALGPSLTSSEPQTRGRGIQLLSKVLQQCCTSLSEKEVQVLTAFYENRLKDYYVITPHVLQGLKALTLCPVLPAGLAVSILKSLFQDVHVQSLMQTDRSCVYNILISLMESCEEELKGLGADFVFGFVQAIDGEKDPRNLLLAFQIAQNILYRNYELGSFTEELFEVTSCYFPIDFYPPPNDPHGISREELILSLRAVLAGTPRFAEFLLPLLIEKLDSDVQSSKLDSLQTLAACAACYGHRELKEFLPSLWSSVRREVFQTASEKVESAGLSALRALTACLSRSVLDSDSEDLLNTFLDLVLKDCQHHLCEPDLKLVWPSTKLLQAAASASYRASYKITAAVVPLLLEQYNNHTQNAQRRTLVQVLHGFIQPHQGNHTEEGDENPLTGYRQPLCALVFSALTESSPALQTAAVKTLTALGSQPGLLSEEDIDLAADHLTRLVLREEEPQTCSAAMEAAGCLARLHPTAFASRMVPALKQEIFSAMEECEGSPAAQSQRALRQRSLKALSAVSTHPSLVQETVPILLQALSVSHKGSASFDLEEVVSACRSLQQITELAKDSEESGRYFHQSVIPRLLGLAVQASLQGGGVPNPLIEERVLSAMVPIFSTACGCLHTQLAAHTASLVLSLFLDGDASFLPENNFPQQFQLLKERSNGWPQTQLVCLLMACVCSLPKSVEVPKTDRLLSELEELSCSCVHPFTHTSAAKCFAGLVNKHPAGEQLDSILKRSVKRIESGLGNDSPNRMQVYTLLLWVSKALLLRYHPLSTTLTDKLLSLLVDRELGSLAADGVALLMNDSADVLNRACHADVRMMYRQRFFTETAPKLVLGFNCAPEERKSSYLKALSHILNSLPRQVQITELPSLLPLLLEALSCPDLGVQLSTLSCLHPLLLDTPQVMTSHLKTLLSRLLALTTSPAMKVRITSLQCLKALTRLPEHVVLPSRPRMLHALAVPLGDKKRLVRREAVLARGEWFLLGSPGR